MFPKRYFLNSTEMYYQLTTLKYSVYVQQGSVKGQNSLYIYTLIQCTLYTMYNLNTIQCSTNFVPRSSLQGSGYQAAGEGSALNAAIQAAFIFLIDRSFLGIFFVIENNLLSFTDWAFAAVFILWLFIFEIEKACASDLELLDCAPATQGGRLVKESCLGS